MATGFGVAQYAASGGTTPIGSGPPGARTRRERYEILRSQLEEERASFIPTWRDLADYFMPRRPRFFTTDINRGERRNQRIVDSTPVFAARTLASVMMGGITSPARPWFRLGVRNRSLMELEPVKLWLDAVTREMLDVFLRSNLYNSLPLLYGEIGTFGTGCLFIEEDFERVLHTQVFPIGSYMIGTDERGRARVFFREFQMTVRQIVQQFGMPDGPHRPIDWTNLSERVKSHWANGQQEQWIQVCHVVEPNPEYDPRRVEARFKRYRSVYYERGMYGKNQKSSYLEDRYDKFLSESGYDNFPALVVRWEVTGEDFYGTNSPGLVALGDVRQLMAMQRRKAQAIEKMVNPPMKATTDLRHVQASTIAGSITYVNTREGASSFEPVHQVDPKVQELLLDIADVRRNIQRAFYEDLFLMLAIDQRLQRPTATEVDERREEKLLALGPVLERLNQELLDPLIDLAFEFMLRQGLIPEPPEELSGMPLKVEYISIMAQAQKLVARGGIDSFFRFVAFAVQTNPNNLSMLDKVDFDQAFDAYGEITSVPPGIIRSDRSVAVMRAQRAQAAAEQAAAEQAAAAAKAARDLAGADLSGDNALRRVAELATAGNVVENI